MTAQKLEETADWLRREIAWMRDDATSVERRPWMDDAQRAKGEGMLSAYLIVHEILTGERA